MASASRLTPVSSSRRAAVGSAMSIAARSRSLSVSRMVSGTMSVVSATPSAST
jgi:hypothetical protein